MPATIMMGHRPTSSSEFSLSSSTGGVPASSSQRGGRNRWRGARERDRLQARFQIQERMRAGVTELPTTLPPPNVATTAAESGSSTTYSTSLPSSILKGCHLAPSSSSIDYLPENAAYLSQHQPDGPIYTTSTSKTTITTTKTTSATTSDTSITSTIPNAADPYDDSSRIAPSISSRSSVEILQEALQRIGKNNVAYFSLSCLNQHLELFNRPFPVQHVLWWTQSSKQEECRIVANTSAGGENSDIIVTTSTTATTHHDVQRRLVSEPQLLSRWGCDRLRRFQVDFIPTLYSCTLVEWAVWTERDNILPALLLGGIDVTRHGKRRMITCTTSTATTTAIVSTAAAESSSSSSSLPSRPTAAATTAQKEQQRQKRNVLLGRRFFQLQAPCSLKAYLVKRVHELRKQTLIQQCRAENNVDDGDVAFVDVCQTCHAQSSPPSDDNDDDDSSSCCELVQFTPCHHVLCTTCVWTDLIDNCAARWDRSDIFVCPICDRCCSIGDVKETSSLTLQSSDTTTSLRCLAQSRRAETMEKFQALPLPVDRSVDQKKSKRRRRRRQPCCSSWASAINTGSTQAVRMEKFFKALDTMTMVDTNKNIDNDATTTTAVSSSYSFVQHYLRQGVNVDGRGEYGETGLWLAVWRNQSRLVRLLLEYGSDPHAAAHGDVSCLQLARTLGHTAVLNLLRQMGGDDDDDDKHHYEPAATATQTKDGASSILLNYSHKTLIDVRTAHAGAGSYIFDNFLPDATIDALIRLRERIPVAPSIKDADKPCSIRSYYCDALGLVVNPLSRLLVRAFGTDNVKVFPYMRFLYYQEAGVELAPHVDLSRADPDTGLRSTHSFLLYLTTCDTGGETTLLQGLPESERNIVLCKIQPVRGRLLIFPHQCPHEGLAVIDVPKHLIRGEVYIPEGWEPTRGDTDQVGAASSFSQMDKKGRHHDLPVATESRCP